MLIFVKSQSDSSTTFLLFSGIECWACSTDGFDPDMHSECIDDPEIGRKVTCSSDQTHCYDLTAGFSEHDQPAEQLEDAQQSCQPRHQPS